MTHNTDFIPNAAQGEKQREPRRTIRIAIAEDQPILREALRSRLALEPDLEVVAEIGDAKQALDIVEHTRPDILLLGSNRSEPDGIATLRQLRAYHLQTRIIVLAASDDKSKHIQAIKCGAAGVVLKQTTAEMLIKSIRKVHSGEIWLDRRTMAALAKRFAGPGPAVSPRSATVRTQPPGPGP